MICWPYWIGETKKVTSLVRRLGSYWIILNLKKYCIGRSTLHEINSMCGQEFPGEQWKLPSVHLKFSRELCKAWLQGVFKDSLLAFTSWLFSPELWSNRRCAGWNISPVYQNHVAEVFREMESCHDRRLMLLLQSDDTSTHKMKKWTAGRCNCAKDKSFLCISLLLLLKMCICQL